MFFSVSLLFAEKPIPIKLAELPEPASDIRELIATGLVTMEAGEREDSQTPQSSPNIIAETHYRIAYNYHTQTRWQIDSGNRQVVVTVRFRDIEWQPRHTIWFRNRPATEGFWSDRLVLHEFDHVRISTDPRVAERFEQLLRSRRSITKSLSAGDIVNRAFVDRLVDEHVSKIFSEIADLISIRYKELDRETSHGRNPLPADSSLSELLRPTAPGTRDSRPNRSGSE